ncbi:ROK family transcriptional regulator [Mesorhizobium sp. B2-3-3]|uniref:ROK family transcriptional regulator n=1 Tax=unclassified Streptomyces TaxID=2593676 RepID=UPI0011665903|nr:ROK family transcriptional regulator [Streptomyces sp. WI03-5b]MDX2624750.1 ROK family transcriptional regulator [Streptomyces sp. WI03-5b]TPN27981.1 ROK family transcriptional regulator [Mesorhizobium sp. B2-3-3]
MAGTTPGTPRVLRAMNDRAALDLLVAQGPLTRTRIGELTGLSKPTASQLLARLEDASLVRSTGSQRGRPGPNAVLYEIDPAAAHVAALSVGPTGIDAVVADVTGTVVGSCRVEADAVAEDVRHRTAQLVAEAVDGALRPTGLGHDDLDAVVIGTPGAIDPHTGQLRYAPHLPGWHSRTLLADLAEVVGRPVVIENDVNLAAVAEQYEGVAQDHDHFVLAYLDEGVGAAIVLGGTLLRGATGGAGEIGYMPLPGAPLARGGVADWAGPDAGGGFQSQVSCPAVRDLAGGRPLAEALADEAVRAEVARRLATGLASVVAVVDPELVVLSGRVAQEGGEELRERVEAEMTGLALPRPLLRISDIEGDPILTGALRTALAQARDSVFDTA